MMEECLNSVTLAPTGRCNIFSAYDGVIEYPRDVSNALGKCCNWRQELQRGRDKEK